MDLARENCWSRGDHFDELLLGRSLPGYLAYTRDSITTNDLVHDYAQTPDVAFFRVAVFYECLRAHVQSSSDIIVHLLLRSIHHF